MNYLFGVLCLGLLCLGLIFLLPVLQNLSAGSEKKSSLSFIFVSLFGFIIFTLYAFLGSPQHTVHYYSKEGKQYRITQDKMRPLFSQVKKQQARLRLRLLENEQDALAKVLLLELLGVEALYQEDHKLALNFWQAALEILPKGEETDPIRLRILGLKSKIEN